MVYEKKKWTRLTEQTWLRLTPETDARLREHAKSRGIKRSTVIRKMLEKRFGGGG